MKGQDRQWDIPDPTTSDKNAPRGTFSNAGLISPYFKVENYHVPEKGKWLIPIRSYRLAKLRKRLAAVRAEWGNSTIADTVEPRPGAGQPIIGPMPLPQSRQPRPRPSVVHPINPDFRPEIQVVGSWYFRAGLHRRDADHNPLFTCLGLEV